MGRSFLTPRHRFLDADEKCGSDSDESHTIMGDSDLSDQVMRNQQIAGSLPQMEHRVTPTGQISSFNQIQVMSRQSRDSKASDTHQKADSSSTATDNSTTSLPPGTTGEHSEHSEPSEPSGKSLPKRLPNHPTPYMTPLISEQSSPKLLQEEPITKEDPGISVIGKEDSLRTLDSLCCPICVKLKNGISKRYRRGLANAYTVRKSFERLAEADRTLLHGRRALEAKPLPSKKCM
ncbi:MAG: hypothetical protein M1812_005665 [Candelaria pacifica]|nr:MAG: hypothetical protein M1812_005665 [Candelaria pacifica]